MRKSNNKGFTLVELMVSLAILALIIVAISGIMFSNNVIFKKSKADINVQEVALDTYNKFSGDLMQARNIYIEGYTVSSEVKFPSNKVGTSISESTDTSTVVGYLNPSDIALRASKPGTKDYDVFINEESSYNETELNKKRESLKADTSKLNTFNSYYEKIRYMGAADKVLYANFQDYVDDHKTSGASIVSNSSLKSTNYSNAQPHQYKNLYVTKVIIQYYVPMDNNYTITPSSSTYDTCYVTYTFGKNASKKIGEVRVRTTYSKMTKLNTSEIVYTDYLNYVVSDNNVIIPGVLAKVDGENDSIQLEMFFSKNSMNYTAEGIASMRNSYVLHDAK